MEKNITGINILILLQSLSKKRRVMNKIVKAKYGLELFIEDCKLSSFYVQNNNLSCKTCI